MGAKLEVKFKWWHGALILALLLAILSPLASSSPDGLEKVAEDKGFISVALGPFFRVVPDYLIPGVTNEALATILAGIVGTLVLFGIGYGLAKLLRAKKGEA
jgi:VIT1/CCC1 family predicted Fe2+/Mn2+ transporter